MFLHFEILNPAFDYFFSVIASLTFIWVAFLAILIIIKD